MRDVGLDHLIRSVPSSRCQPAPSSRDIVYEPEDHALRVVARGQVIGRIVTKLGGFAYHPRGFHPPRYSSPTVEDVMALIENEIETGILGSF